MAIRTDGDWTGLVFVCVCAFVRIRDACVGRSNNLPCRTFGADVDSLPVRPENRQRQQYYFKHVPSHKRPDPDAVSTHHVWDMRDKWGVHIAGNYGGNIFVTSESSGERPLLTLL